MSKLILTEAKASTNGKSVILKFTQVTERDWSVASKMSDFQRANGMEAAGGTDTITRYADERVDLKAMRNIAHSLLSKAENEAHALKAFTDEQLISSMPGKAVSGYNIQTLRSATPFYVVDGKPQNLSKAGDYFDGILKSAEPGEGVPADRTVTPETAPDRYRIVTGTVTKRGADAVAAWKLSVAEMAQATTKKQTVAAGDEDDSL